MAGNAPAITVPQLPKAKVAIISSSWHLDICSDLVAGATRALEAAQKMFEKGYDAVVAVGLVLKGETPHFDYVCQGVTQGVIDVQLKWSKPIGYGVLMCENLEQAIARSGRPGSKEDKGYDSAIAALTLLTL